MSLKWDIVPFTAGNGIQINPMGEKLFPHFVGVDADQLKIFVGAAFDFAVTCSNDVDWDDAWRVIKPGGHYVVVEGEERLRVWKKGPGNERVPVEWVGRAPGKKAAVVRYGAFGDMIQTSSILPALRSAGFTLTLFCGEEGYNIIKHDPHVDEFVVQSKNQVPNHELGPYWRHWMKRFDRWVNLSESVEGTLLALPGRPNHGWPGHVRHKYMNRNYLEFTHELAGVKKEYHPKFYATNKEKKWAKKQRARINGPVILWALSGSSVHKNWPYLDQVVARFMLETSDVHFIFVGDKLTQILETGWELEPRVKCKSGVWSIRETLSFIEQADLVIGPETGVLNAASMLPVPKITYLSHSSENNLTRDWINNISLTPDGCACYPCHQMHNGFKYCSRDDKTGAAECQAKIPAEDMIRSIKQQLEFRRAA